MSAACTSSTRTCRRPASGAPSSPRRRRARRPETVRLTFEVHDSSPTVSVGQQAPASVTPTLADVGGDVAKISTDPKPDPAFYSTSVKDALAAHKPFMLIFATPKFCTSAQCGPTLDRFKPIAAANPAVTFINVEPYKLHDVDGQLQPVLDANNNLQATDVTNQWGLLTEPWIFAVDRAGIVRGSYEVTASDAEIKAVLAQITGRRLTLRAHPRAGSRAGRHRSFDTRPGPAARSPGAPRGDPARTAPRSRGRAGRSVSDSPVPVRKVNPETLSRPAESTPTITPTIDSAPDGSAVPPEPFAPRRTAAPTPSTTIATSAATNRLRVRPSTGGSLSEPRRRSRRLRSRCCPARGAASRRHSAGRSRRPARRSAGRAARARGADRTGRWPER